VNKDMFINILRRLMDGVKNKTRQMESQQLVSLSRQYPNTPVGFDQEILTKEQCDSTGTSLYSPEMSPHDFYLFPRLRSASK